MFGFNFSQYKCDGCGNSGKYHPNTKNKPYHNEINKNHNISEDEINIPNNNQKQRKYNHNYQPGSYSPKFQPMKRKYDNNNENQKNNDQIQSKPIQLPINPYKIKNNPSENQQKKENCNENNLNQGVNRAIIPNSKGQNINEYHQNKNANTNFNNNQIDYHKPEYGEGECSSKPFVNYYRNELLSLKQRNQTNQNQANINNSEQLNRPNQNDSPEESQDSQNTKNITKPDDYTLSI